MNGWHGTSGSTCENREHSFGIPKVSDLVPFVQIWSITSNGHIFMCKCPNELIFEALECVIQVLFFHSGYACFVTLLQLCINSCITSQLMHTSFDSWKRHGWRGWRRPSGPITCQVVEVGWKLLGPSPPIHLSDTESRHLLGSFL